MKKLGSEVKYCILCKDVHEVDIVESIDCIEYRCLSSKLSHLI